MDLDEANRVSMRYKELYGDKPCLHPAIEKEYARGAATGDYVCVTCGLDGNRETWDQRRREQKARES